MPRKARRIAAIDVGTNSIHMIIAECRGRACRVIDKEKEMVQLGEGSLGGEPLTEAAIGRGVDALRRMAEIARRWEVDQIEAAATSAVREAPNQRRFVREVEKAAGIRVRVISGHEEADLIFRAVRSAVDFQSGTALSIDIGGGSIELTVGTESEIFFTASEPLGALRITQQHLAEDLPSAESLQRCRDRIRKMLKKPMASIRSLGFDFCIGTSGTITTLAELAGKGEPVAAGLRWLDRESLVDLSARLASIPASERAEVFGIEPQRAGTLLAGALVLEEFMRGAKVNRMRACSAALREGLIERALAKADSSPRRDGGVRRQSVNELAERSVVDREHARQVARLALRIFDQTQSLHGMKPSERELLEYAALLHEIGLHVSYQGHHKHTYYLIRHAGLAGFTEDQVAALASIARYHRKAKPSIEHENFQELPEAQQRFVEKATAILRMADALDRGRKQAVRDVAVDVRNGRIAFRLRQRLDARIELEAASKRSRFLGEVLEHDTSVAIERGSR
ncbi:MAG TPA: Ppx/GppA phosphatase family protein [Thermoanaerobaculia bacterium]|nr:Ppx/GppA phosphatase family protein [Thermoanaerobaculia bacterium]